MPKGIFNSRHRQYGPKTQRRKIVNKMISTRISLLVIAGVLAMAPMISAQSSMKSDANPVSITGKVSCSKFGLGSVSARKGMSVAQTIQYCANFQGGEYTLVAGNKIYKLSGDTKMLAKMSGQTVEVAGRLVPESTDTAAMVQMGTVAITDVVPTKE
jgi:hypothetical protein